MYGGLAVHLGFLLPREVTFVISHAQPSARGFCQARLSLKGPMPDHQPHPNPSIPGPCISPWPYTALIERSLPWPLSKDGQRSAVNHKSWTHMGWGIWIHAGNRTGIIIMGLRNNAEISHCITAWYFSWQSYIMYSSYFSKQSYLTASQHDIFLDRVT